MGFSSASGKKEPVRRTAALNSPEEVDTSVDQFRKKLRERQGRQATMLTRLNDQNIFSGL